MDGENSFPVAFMTIEVTLPSGKKFDYVLDVVRARQFILGRNSELLIEDPMVSQRHALVCFDPERGWELMDLNSTNGTMLNGQPISSGNVLPLNNGDVMELGQSIVKVTRMMADMANAPNAVPAEQVNNATLLRVRIPDGANEAALRSPSKQFRQELEKLRIEIDQARKEREVVEITESPFFQELQKKVGRLRRPAGGH